MIIRVDSNSEKFQKLLEAGVGSEADVIFESHFVDDSSDSSIHPIKGTGKKALGKVLGWGEISSFFHTTISSCEEKYINAIGQPDRIHLKRIFHALANRQVENITRAKLKLFDIEKYWCSYCESWDLYLLPKDILSEKIAFLCRDCNQECHLDSREDAGYFHVKIKAIDGLEGRYKTREEWRAKRRKLLSGEEVVMLF